MKWSSRSVLIVVTSNAGVTATCYSAVRLNNSLSQKDHKMWASGTRRLINCMFNKYFKWKENLMENNWILAYRSSITLMPYLSYTPLSIPALSCSVWFHFGIRIKFLSTLIKWIYFHHRIEWNRNRKIGIVSLKLYTCNQIPFMFIALILSVNLWKSAAWNAFIHANSSNRYEAWNFTHMKRLC